PAAEVTEIGEKSILPQTEITVRYTFLKCGHILEQAYANRELVGLTGAQVETLWNNAHIMELEKTHALIEREMPACCPAHYLLQTKKDDSLWYSKTDQQDYTRQTETEIPFDVSVLHEDVQKALQEGIVFDRLNEIDAYLEGVES
ncbi:MAG: hypothetical protein PHO41_06750, partial [Eubacteriales bacterium]|nr:hypothetical protein [Eubacteriales bacterium]